ncbi:MAG: family 20 glycosylhydrolase [Lentisphaeria bacterium]|nr:family 20 glycosylhydrolase [Lentisphaeria bacterium]
MRKNYLHLDFKGIAPLLHKWKEYLELFQKLGFDGLLLELDCKYAWKTWQGVTRDQYSETDVRSMISTARKMGFSVSLLIQMQGHLEWALSGEKYASLRENNFIDEICPNNSDAVKKIEEWIDEAIDLCPDAPYLHLGGDEVWHLCSCPICQKSAADAADAALAVYLEHVRLCCKRVVAKGIRPMLWADMFVSRKSYSSIKTLPPETVIVNWCYNEKAPFAGLKEMADTGHEIWGAPAIRCGPDNLSGIYDESRVAARIENIRQWQQTGVNLLHTVWGRPASFNFLYPPWHSFAEAFAAAGTNGAVWDISGDDDFAVQSRRWQSLGEKYTELQSKGFQLFKSTTGMLQTCRHIGNPELFNAAWLAPAEKLDAEIREFAQELRSFFEDNGLSDAEEFTASRLAMLRPALPVPDGEQK